jgi:hypothetical protein
MGLEPPYLRIARYALAIVVATWLAGTEGGILATGLSVFLGNYFFVPPRHEWLPNGEDWPAMGMAAGMALFLVWFVGRWRHAEHGDTVIEEEMHIVHSDGSRRITSSYAAPVRDETVGSRASSSQCST